MASYVKCMRIFATSVPVKNQFTEQWIDRHKIRRNIQIRKSGAINTPLTYGVLHPVILVPKKMNWNEEEKMSYILEHEFVHIKRMDLVLKSILILISSLHWFNPMVWMMYLLCNRDLELSCDEMVIFNYGIENRSHYANVLINMEESKGSFMPMCNYFSKNVIEERIKSIMKTKKVSKSKVIAASVLVAGVSILCVFSIRVKATEQYGETTSELPAAWEGTTSIEQSLSARLEQSSRFPEYEKYGLSYDENSGYLMYDNKTVGYFIDEFKENTYCRFVVETGETGVEVKRDANWNITGIEAFPMTEVLIDETSQINIDNNHESPMTEVMIDETSQISVDNNYERTSTGKGDDSAAEAGYGKDQNTDVEAIEMNSGEVMTPNEDYIKAGLEWKNNEWNYSGKTVAVIYDDNGSIYNNDSGIIYLKITRDKNQLIDKITEITKDEM